MSKSKIKNKALELLEEVVNPQTQSSLFEERRVVDVQADNNTCNILLNDSDISEKGLEKIKKTIVEKLSSLYPQQSIHISSKSSSTGRQKADLRVGHEKNAEKEKA